ncbi:SurA N-terminal domain-containing protein [Pseudothauera rhizosphaerae]|uniref:Periplasmic chaperone PpiD n=1 Tax=Pseudothauera rhizosphaerae TaxID=2565932 RepID=A0A4S4ATX5_9RHOO|nr:SurA N-terminal domain-containing protein [Pseudothauera rhizosphaerae]THF63371.1 peptidylprolyl isomerase [Pseudothauera rhizosphaerae]
MFEAVRNNKRFAQIILAILIIPFAFFGMDAYFTDGPTGSEVAVVGGSRIGTVEFEEALRTQQDRLRETMGGQVDRSLLDSPELRSAVLENLVNQRVLALYAAENGFVVTQAQLQEAIVEVPAFQDEGRFSMERYEALLRAQGMTPASFEARLSQDIRIQQLALAVGDASFAAAESPRRFLSAQLEERRVSELPFPAADQLAKVQLAEDAAQRFYDANPARFERPARIKAEYLVFDETALLGQVGVTEEEVRQVYEGSPERFGVAEERRARHILLELPADAGEEQIKAVQADADTLAARVKAAPDGFPALARERSADPGSATRGGDLGFFGRGVMVKPFEDAVFAAAKGEIVGPVRSEFGYHIIQVTDVKPAALRPLDEVRAEIEAELKGRKAGQRQAELAELFANTVYEQPDSLAPAAELLKLEIRHSDWIQRGSAAVGPYTSERLVAALFSDDGLEKRRNTEAIEVGTGTLVAARVVEHEAAQRLPFDQVKGEIEDALRAEEAVRLATAAGEAALAAAGKGEAVDGKWSETLTLQRGATVLSPAATQAVFGAATASLPAYVGVAQGAQGYAVYRIDAVNRPQLAADDPRLAGMTRQYAQLMAERDFSAYLALLRERYGVEIRAEAVNPPRQQ